MGEDFREAFAEAFREALSKGSPNQEQEQEQDQDQEHSQDLRARARDQRPPQDDPYADNPFDVDDVPRIGTLESDPVTMGQLASDWENGWQEHHPREAMRRNGK